MSQRKARSNDVSSDRPSIKYSPPLIKVLSINTNSNHYIPKPVLSNNKDYISRYRLFSNKLQKPEFKVQKKNYQNPVNLVQYIKNNQELQSILKDNIEK